MHSVLKSRSKQYANRTLVRSLVVLAALLALSSRGVRQLVVTEHVQAQTGSSEPLSKRQIRSLIDEYFDGPTDERAVEIEGLLEEEDPALCTPAFKSQLSKNKNREHVLDFAIKLGVPKLFHAAKKHIDDSSVVEYRFITLVFTTRDKGSEEFLIDRWMEKGKDTTSFELLDSAFEENSFEEEGLERLRYHLRDKDTNEERKQSICILLNNQLGREGLTASEILDDWKNLLAEREKRKEAAEAAKYDATLCDTYFADEGVTQNEEGIEIPAEKCIGLRSFTEEQNTTNTNIRFRIKAPDAEGTQLIFKSEGPKGFITTAITLKGQIWHLSDTAGNPTLGRDGRVHNAKHATGGEFLEFTLTTTPKEPVVGPANRLSIFVGDKNFTGENSTLTTAADIHSFTIKAGTGSVTVKDFSIKSNE